MFKTREDSNSQLTTYGPRKKTKDKDIGVNVQNSRGFHVCLKLGDGCSYAGRGICHKHKQSLAGVFYEAAGIFICISLVINWVRN